ncbi:BAR/IMD domain-containing adapter protein 2-like 2 [Embiotoca jacksoni]|uniref:BAR/IMD domain-containing adapter protein 2-like 2 n=1 Tax=Embiotoca jacksoni TaxID=100190 RepID=UPI0037049F0D
MTGMNSDQLHRSTLGIYSSLIDEFNPSLQKLVSLGNSYVQAFSAFAVTSEAYFSALSKIGEKAYRTMSSRSLGDVLVQISDNQRKLTLELGRVFQLFSAEGLQEMDKNIHLDKGYISSSRDHYEVEVHKQAAVLERQLKRGTRQDCSEYVQFLRESHSEALKEEERRYRFLAEKHCGLTQSIAQLMNKTGDTLQQRTEAWTDEVDATRQPITLNNTRGMKEDEFRRSREELTLGKVPSRAPSPQGSISRYSVDSLGGGGRSMRARVAHQPAGSNPTLLPFSKGQIITVLVQQPRNGWLYGRVDNSSRQGWFPASYVEAVDDLPKSTSSSIPRSSSMSNLLDQPGISSHGGAPPPPPPPPLQSLSLNKQSDMRPMTATCNRRPESEKNKRSEPHHSQPELFPRGTNPFATVKLKPTSTNDRSAPSLQRR